MSVVHSLGLAYEMSRRKQKQKQRRRAQAEARRRRVAERKVFIGVDYGKGKDKTVGTVAVQNKDGTIHMIPMTDAEVRLVPRSITQGISIDQDIFKEIKGGPAAEALAKANIRTMTNVRENMLPSAAVLSALRQGTLGLSVSMGSVAKAVGKTAQQFAEMGEALKDAGWTEKKMASEKFHAVRTQDVGCKFIECKTCNGRGFDFAQAVNTFCNTCDGTGQVRRMVGVKSYFDLCPQCVQPHADQFECQECEGRGSYLKPQGSVRLRVNLLYDSRLRTEVRTVKDLTALKEACIPIVTKGLAEKGYEPGEEARRPTDMSRDGSLRKVGGSIGPGAWRYGPHLFVTLAKMLRETKRTVQLTASAVLDAHGGQILPKPASVRPLYRLWTQVEISMLLRELWSNHDWQLYFSNICRQVVQNTGGHDGGVALKREWTKECERWRDDLEAASGEGAVKAQLIRAAAMGEDGVDASCPACAKPMLTRDGHGSNLRCSACGWQATLPLAVALADKSTCTKCGGTGAYRKPRGRNSKVSDVVACDQCAGIEPYRPDERWVDTGGGNAELRPRPADIKASLRVPDARMECPACHSRGWFGVKPCRACKGRGTVDLRTQIPSCQVCNGTGIDPTDRKPCVRCGARPDMVCPACVDTGPPCNACGSVVRPKQSQALVLGMGQPVKRFSPVFDRRVTPGPSLTCGCPQEWAPDDDGKLCTRTVHVLGCNAP